MVQVACNSWEFGDWGGGNKSLTGVCEQSRKCYSDIFGVEWEDEGVGEEREEGFYGGEGLT
jgi:alpha 1,2-mannosyltransferase